MKERHCKRRVQSLIIVVFCIVVIQKVPSWFASHGAQFLISNGILVHPIHRLAELGLFPTLLSLTENIGALFTAVLLLILFRELQSRVKGKGNTGNNISMKKSDAKRLCLLGLMGAGAAQAITFCLKLLPADMQAVYGASMSIALNGRLACFLFIITHIIIVPVREEMVFRGLSYEILRSSWGWGGCTLLLTILFAGNHRNAIQVAYALCMGALLSVIREFYGSVLYTIAFHIMFNLSGSHIFLSEYTKFFMYTGTIVFIISVILVALDMKKMCTRELTERSIRIDRPGK